MIKKEDMENMIKENTDQSTIQNRSVKIQTNEIFTSIQGEGFYTGVPSTFVRLVGCNLRCVFRESICDSAYTSHFPEPANFSTVGEVIDEIKRQHGEYPSGSIKHVVITGGEPMRQQKGIQALIDELGPEYTITIETNGTFETTLTGVDLYSISPKLSSSENFDTEYAAKLGESAKKKHKRERINYKAIYSLLNNDDLTRVQLKFVYSDEGSEQEIKDWLKGYQSFERGMIDAMKSDLYTGPYDDPFFKEGIEFDYPDSEYINDLVMLMPEGERIDQISNKAEEVANVCIRNGWRMTDRLHIRIWGDKRAV